MAIVLTELGSLIDNTGPSMGVPFITISAGSLIFVSVYDRSTSGLPGTVTDDAGNTYTLINFWAPSNNSLNGQVQSFYAWNCHPLSTNTISYTKPDGNSLAAMDVMSATGILNTSDPLDGNFTSNGIGNQFFQPTATSGTPSSINELVIATVGWPGLAADTFTQDSTNAPWASPPIVNEINQIVLAGGNIVNHSASAVTYAPSLSTARAWAILIQGFLPAPVPAAVDDTTVMMLG
jgi:hypothetical protein